MRNLLSGIVLLASSLSFTPLPAVAQTSWPARPVTVVVPFPAGGSTDVAARMMASQLQKDLGQTFLVENRPGATGSIGAGYVKRAAPDGYTLMVSSLGTYVIAPHLQKSLPYDARTDFDYISVLVRAPNVLVAAPAQKARTVADVIAQLKAHPDTITFASSGNGASDHLSAEVFWQQTGTSGLHVPYKGGAPAINDLLGNQVQYSFQNVNAVLQYIRAGQLHAIAVTGNRRSAVLPDVPTLAEAGVRDAEVYSWQGLAAPKGLPPEVKARLSAAVIAAMKNPDVEARMVEQGLEVVADTPAHATAFQAQEWERWRKLITERHITVN
jgi:tripartite-type tricarboxylate transporter receptor subunit TctC